jgi:two-component system phosphate regulon response regulator PhoB
MQSTVPSPSTILVVDDEPDAVELIEFNLKRAGYAVLVALDGWSGLRAAREHRPNLVLLDLMLPEMNGFEISRALRQEAQTAEIPIIFLTARAAEMDRQIGLELGAEDYITKPFSPRELLAQIQRTLESRPLMRKLDQYQFGDLFIDVPHRAVSVGANRADLSNVEFKLLLALVERHGRLQSRERLLHDVWSGGEYLNADRMDDHARRLKEKLGPCGRFLEILNAGYRFMERPPHASHHNR